MASAAPSSVQPSPASMRKSILVFLLEDILFPGKINPAVDAKAVQKLLKSVQKYAKSNPSFSYYGVSAHQVAICAQKLKEAKLSKFFPDGKVFAVDDAFIQKMAEIDRELYEKKCAEDAECKDEYARQVQLQELMKKENLSPEQILFVGHDYWFDAFYTRRFSKVDVALVESALSNKGHLAPERVEGLWHISLKWEELLPLIEGKGTVINYAPLDAFIVTSISKELFGGQGFTLQKKVLDLRQIKNKPLPDANPTPKTQKP